MPLATFYHHCLNKSLTWICPTCHLPSYLNNNLNSCRLTDENIYNFMALDYNSNDSDISVIGGSSFKPTPNTTSNLKCNNKNIKSILKNLKIMCINLDSLRSVDKRAELNCLVNHHNPHIYIYRSGI